MDSAILSEGLVDGGGTAVVVVVVVVQKCLTLFGKGRGKAGSRVAG